MQKYAEKSLIPNNLPHSSSTCCDESLDVRQKPSITLIIVAILRKTFGSFRNNPYICTVELLSGNIMCTVTLSYDHNNALARRKLAALLATGLFSQESVNYKEPSQEEIEAYRQEREVFMNHSKKSMSNVIARYL